MRSVEIVCVGGPDDGMVGYDKTGRGFIDVVRGTDHYRPTEEVDPEGRHVYRHYDASTDNA